MRKQTPDELLMLALLGGNASKAITDSEKQGAEEIIISSQLPIATRGANDSLEQATEDYGKIGIKVLGIVENDKIFVNAILPQGWTRKTTGHDMWTEVRDAKDRVRINVFYKAAFYDRSSHASFKPFYKIEHTPVDNTYTNYKSSVKDANGNVLHQIENSGDYDANNDELVEWLNRSYPMWRDYSAYWD